MLVFEAFWGISYTLNYAKATKKLTHGLRRLIRRRSSGTCATEVLGRPEVWICFMFRGEVAKTALGSLLAVISSPLGVDFAGGRVI